MARHSSTYLGLALLLALAGGVWEMVVSRPVDGDRREPWLDVHFEDLRGLAAFRLRVARIGRVDSINPGGHYVMVGAHNLVPPASSSDAIVFARRDAGTPGHRQEAKTGAHLECQNPVASSALGEQWRRREGLVEVVR